MSYQTLKIEVEESAGICVITLNRPEQRNALSDLLMRELKQAIAEFEVRQEIRCIVLTGSKKAFAAGADITEMRHKTYMQAYKDNFVTDTWEAVAHCRKPVIAAVAGYALGGGCELALMCDFIIAADNAKFGQPEINLGILPGGGGTQRLTRVIGKSKAMEMCLTGRMMDAKEAERCGLVARVVPLDELMDVVKESARAIAGKSLPVVMMIKECVEAAYDTPLAEGLRLERRLFHSVFGSDDQQEGMEAFLQKRQPHFRHQ